MLSGSAGMAAARVVEWGQTRCAGVRLTSHNFLVHVGPPRVVEHRGWGVGLRNQYVLSCDKNPAC